MGAQAPEDASRALARDRRLPCSLQGEGVCALREVNRELEAILDACYDEIFVVDAEGTVLKVNAACERLYGLRPQDLIGRNVKELEAEGVFYPSIASMVVAQKRRITTVQTTRLGKQVICTSNPVFDDAGNVVKVVSISRDITEIAYLRQELENTREQSLRYSSELAELRKKVLESEGIVAASQAMRAAIDLAYRVAGADCTVLLLGESGVGKDLLARLIHVWSPRAGGPFVKVNCGAIPESLLESELFGYEAGAFTGARREGKPGLIQVAHGGTFFLDEVSELPLSLQVKLLHVLQDRQVYRLGAARPVTVDVRVIAASNRDLKRLVEEQRFREDLYYRLNVVPIEIPPLRDRPEDIPPLVFHFMHKACAKYGRTVSVSPHAMKALMAYHWPGNVRELENMVERLVVTVEGNEITLADLPEAIREKARCAPGAQSSTFGFSLRDRTREFERRVIAEAIAEAGTVAGAARRLGIHHSTLLRKARKLNVL